MTPAKLKATFDSRWGPHWQTTVQNKKTGPRKLAAAAAVLLGEMTIEQAEKRFSVNSKSPSGKGDVTWGHATRIVKAAINGDAKPLIEALEGLPGRDICRIGAGISSGKKLDVYTLTQERIDRLTNTFINLGVGQVKIRPSSAENFDFRSDVEFHVQKIHIGQLEILVKNLRRLR